MWVMCMYSIHCTMKYAFWMLKLMICMMLIVIHIGINCFWFFEFHVIWVQIPRIFNHFVLQNMSIQESWSWYVENLFNTNFNIGAFMVCDWIFMMIISNKLVRCNALSHKKWRTSSLQRIFKKNQHHILLDWGWLGLEKMLFVHLKNYWNPLHVWLENSVWTNVMQWQFKHVETLYKYCLFDRIQFKLI